MANRVTSPRKRTPPPQNRTAKTATSPRLIDEITASLQTLGVALAAGGLDATLKAAETESLSYLEFLHRVLAGPAEAKRQHALERRICAVRTSAN